ncbi:hypothetical protein BTA51_03935 [Hahella sp. CCB-MM4]|uniref:hypothetical protein n=1 Tax=Hahella sp. (strain CCB-MM4) TaxID=1926491 RepID=UPI000B9B0401|nr:hypothetical protein [Hahella sp. CCB-MM4]OZG74177.1 hypothetical protein BTA51_03935 [Hahella sp. CCB-MM4]
MKRAFVVVTAVLTCAMAGAVYWVNKPVGSNLDESVSLDTRSSGVADMPGTGVVENNIAAGAPGAFAGQGIESYIDAMAMELLETYGDTIQNRRTQAKLLAVRDQVLGLYPVEGEAVFARILALAFPGYADQILETINLMAGYENWLAENQLALSEMSFLEREGAIWHKRRQMFGEDAELIWAEEKQAWAQKQQKIQQVIMTLDQSDANSLDETLFQLQSALNDTYGNGVERLAMDNGVIAQVYFGFESVQGKLRGMSPDQRQLEINQLRKQLGYSDEQIQRLEERDLKRNQRWDNGLAYMAERNALTTRLSGPELERELDQLRLRYFKHEAKTIALEEKDGFYRYERPRLYGRN